MRRFALAMLMLGCGTAAAANPVAQPSKLDAPWQARARMLLEQTIEIPTVINRGEVPRMARLISDELKAAGFAATDIRIIPHEGLPGDKTATLIARWRADNPARKPLLILGHMDVVEAKR